MSTTLVILGLIAAAALFLITIYNRLVKARQMVREGFSGIDVQLKKRANLIPNLVAAVKGYMKHEKDLLEKITSLRAKAMEAADAGPAERSAIEQEISRVLGQINVAVENYPDLKANQNVLDLQQQLAQVENDIQLSRRYYNGAVRNNNVLVESFPSNLVATYFKFEKSEYFELENEADRAVPQVQL